MIDDVFFGVFADLAEPYGTPLLIGADATCSSLRPLNTRLGSSL